jgi:hypothetical protein
MRVIAPNMARGAALLCFVALAGAFAAAFAADDAHDDVMEVFANMSGALAEVGGQGAGSARGNVAKFMASVSKDMPQYETIKSRVTGLIRDAEVSSTIQPLTEDIQGETYRIDLDWFLEVRSLEQDGPIVRRRDVVHCELRKEKKHWKIVALKPVDFFAPATLGQ